MAEIWAFEHAVECQVPSDLAWQFWTDVQNWRLDADVETVEINGPFTTGTTGVTVSRASGRIEWRIAEIEAGHTAVLEFSGPGVLARFAWTFESSGHGTRMRQRATLSGEQAPALATQMGPALEEGIPAGMEKLCRTMQDHLKRTIPATV